MKWKIKLSVPVKNYSPQEIIALLFAGRGIMTELEQQQFMNPAISQLDRKFFDLSDFEKAVTIIIEAIQKGQDIIVYSDYDVDGITAAAILWETLKQIGASAYPYVPHRMEEGYGLSVKGIDAISMKYPNAAVIITVDHGITAVEQTKYARNKGFKVIITDHHSRGAETPPAHAIIHSTELAGSGVAYIFSSLLLKKIRNKVNQQLDFQNEHLALAAIGTIADLVPLTKYNRIIAVLGLQYLQKTKRVGLQELLSEIGLVGKYIGVYEIGFLIAPRMNASGRISHGLDALRLLCTHNLQRARELAAKLNNQNMMRQQMVEESVKKALTLVDESKKILCVSDNSFHEGIIGLIAGRLVDRYYKPAIVLSVGDELSKASVRSVAGFNIIESLRQFSSIFESLGGHPLAAGFSIRTDRINTLLQNLESIENQLSDELLEKELTAEMELDFHGISESLYNALLLLSPFGIGNPEPVFISRNVRVTKIKTVGVDNKHLVVSIEQNGIVFEGIGFNMGSLMPALSVQGSIDIAYTISLRTWNAVQSIQLRLRDIHVSKSAD